MRILKVDISNFRRLDHVSIELDEATTLLVGTNNSGKTAAIAAMAWFLRTRGGNEGPRLLLSDIYAARWKELDALGNTWLSLPADLSRDGDTAAELWKEELRRLQDVLPALDLHLEVKDHELNLVSHLIPTLEWTPKDPLRVRLRAELAQSVEELQHLVRRFCEAYRAAHGREGDEPSAWPKSFVEFLARDLGEHTPAVGTWIVDPASTGVSRRLAGRPLEQILRVDIIPAQRGLGTEELDAGDGSGDTRARKGVFTRRLVSHYGDVLKPFAGSTEATRTLHRLIGEAEAKLDGGLEDALADSLARVKKLGYPGLHDPELHLRSRIRSEQLLNHEASVQYVTGGADGVELPEHSIGLGYQNLLMLSFTLVHFRKERHEGPPPLELPARIHLVLAEEPEAHLHVQVQRAFITKARDLLSQKEDEDIGLTTQLVVSTHSSHIAHALPFSHLRYFRRLELHPDGATAFPTTTVVNLTNTFGTEDATRRFVERYLQVQHSDLFFADAAILIEGAAERTLLPLFLETHETPLGGTSLASRYLTVLPIGGAHAHRLRRLIERIGLTTLIITDIDAVAPGTDPDEGKASKKVAVCTGAGQTTSNATLADWLPGITNIDALLDEKDIVREGALSHWPDAWARVAYQVPEAEKGACGRTFEDALVLSNTDWFRAIPPKPKKKPRTALDTMANVVRETEPEELPNELFALLSSKNFDKAEFALDLLMARVDPGQKDWLRCPRYIREGLDWLSKKLALGTAARPPIAAPPPAAPAETPVGEAA